MTAIEITASIAISAIATTLDHELAAVRAAARAARVPVRQLRMAVTTLVIAAAARIEATGDGSPAAVALWHRLCQLVEVEGRAHEDLVPRSRLLGNLFANAAASVSDEFWTRFRWDERVVALCRLCGAPQATPSNVRCRYCDGDIFKGPRT